MSFWLIYGHPTKKQYGEAYRHPSVIGVSAALSDSGNLVDRVRADTSSMAALPLLLPLGYSEDGLPTLIRPHRHIFSFVN